MGLDGASALRILALGDRRDGADQPLTVELVESAHHGEHGVQLEDGVVVGVEGELEKAHGLLAIGVLNLLVEP